MNDHGKVPVLVTNAPEPIGPYSQAIKCHEMLFLSGQIAIDTVTGELIKGDAAAQTRKVMEHIKAVLEASSSGLVRVVKTTIYLTDIADFPAVNKVYGEFFAFEPPARSTVQVAALPKGAKVEIEAIATCKKESSQYGGGMM